MGPWVPWCCCSLSSRALSPTYSLLVFGSSDASACRGLRGFGRLGSLAAGQAGVVCLRDQGAALDRVDRVDDAIVLGFARAP